MQNFDRRGFLRLMGIGAGALVMPQRVAVADKGSPSSGQGASRGKPNFVIIIADDLSRHDIGCYGNKDVRTPNLDKLASQGLKFNRFYSPAAICAPMRQALYTGIYPVKNGAYPNHSHVKPDIKSIPRYLRPLGYRVGLVGKTHFGPAECFPFEYPKSRKKAANAAGKEPGDEGPELPLDFEAAGEFMSRDKAQPFCLVVASHEPHCPWTLGDSSVYRQDKLWVPPYLADTPATRADLAKYYAEVAVLDSEVGEVMRLIDKHGLAENTLFIFLSEQGSMVPFSKCTLYEAGIHAGVIARWPGRIKSGRESAALLSYVDILPTLIEAAGGTAPAVIDGKSFLGVLTGDTDKGDEHVFAEQTSRGLITAPHQLFGIRCVRDNRYKLILNLNPENEMQGASSETAKSWLKSEKESVRELGRRYLKRPPLELYDLDEDQWEMNNLADDPAHAETVKKLRGVLDAWMKQQGDLGAETEAAALSRQGKGSEDGRNKAKKNKD